MSPSLPKRAQRQDPGGRRPTPREILGLRFLAGAQPIGTSQYARYLSMSTPVAWRSLRKLRDLGLVTVHVERMEGENHYVLAAAGRGVLARVLGASPEEFRLLKGPVVASAHHAMLVDFAVTLSLATARAKNLRLVRVAWEPELRRRVGHHTEHALVPDAVVVLADAEGGEMAFAVEIDLASENAGAVGRDKFAPYGALHAAGQPLLGVVAWRVLVLAPSRHRVNVLARAAWDQAEAPEQLFYFAVAGALTDRGVLGDGWVTPRVVGEDACLATESPFAGVRTGCSDRPNSPGLGSDENHLNSHGGTAGPFSEGGR
ncbi:MAG: replication-relaxation family protein [Pseudomonadota bacterium]|nr:replication-relaxation family protein [Pseudomonadota bacterium]